MKHYNTPIFVPHLGCPHDCTFCNQKRITGVRTEPTDDDVRRIMQAHLDTIKGGKIEVAFFGGSFTAIEPEKQNALLNAAYPYIQGGRVQGIRLSTRPDCITPPILDNLKNYGVTAVELGVQSMDDGVLTMNRRGHTAADVVSATALIRQYGFELGHQMMTGLYGSSPERDIETARAIIAQKPDTVRIYPTVVLKDTSLEQLYKQGEYTPPTLEQTVELCKTLVLMFENANIKIIRLGLQAADALQEGGNIVAGAYHPAFGQLVESAIMRDIMEEKLKEMQPCKSVEIYVSPQKLSPAIGDKRCNVGCLRSKFKLDRLKIMADAELTGRKVRMILSKIN